jgi:hypothetical protein
MMCEKLEELTKKGFSSHVMNSKEEGGGRETR